MEGVERLINAQMKLRIYINVYIANISIYRTLFILSNNYFKLGLFKRRVHNFMKDFLIND